MPLMATYNAECISQSANSLLWQTVTELCGQMSGLGLKGCSLVSGSGFSYGVVCLGFKPKFPL